MLTISDAASATIHDMLRVPGVPPEGGLRVQYAPDHERLSILRVSEPRSGDLKYEVGDGAFLFVAAEIADRVRDKTFDARRNDAGRMQFVLDHGDR